MIERKKTMATADANDVALGVEFFDDDDAPLVLLAGGVTMLSWPDVLRAPSGRRAPGGALRPA